MTRKLISCIAAGILIIGLIPKTAKSQITPLNGTWEIINEQSDFGKLEAKIAAPLKIVADNSVDSVRVTRIFGGQNPVTDRFKLDAANVETIIDKNTLRLANVKWDNEHKTLVFKSEYEVEAARWVYWRTETWKVKGELLEVQRTTIMPDKVDRVKAVYQKVK